MKRPRDRGPTRQELGLAVIVCFVLASLLFPVFARSRASQRQAICLANIQLVARAVGMYLTDNDQTFPPRESRADVVGYFATRPGAGTDPRRAGYISDQCPRASDANPYLRHPVILDEYVPHREVWRCPSARLEQVAAFINGSADWLCHLQAHPEKWGGATGLCPDLSWPSGWGGEVTDSLTQGRMALPVADKGRTASPGVFRVSIGVSRPIGSQTSARKVDDPTWYVVCADGGATVDDFCVGTLAYPDICCLECAGPGFWEADWEGCPWSRDCGAVGAMKRAPILREARGRHFGGVNIGFLDGHARWLPSEDVIKEARSARDPSRGRLRGVGPWGPTSDAPRFDPKAVPPLY